MFATAPHRQQVVVAEGYAIIQHKHNKTIEFILGWEIYSIFRRRPCKEFKMTISDENIKIDHNIPTSSSISMTSSTDPLPTTCTNDEEEEDTDNDMLVNKIVSDDSLKVDHNVPISSYFINAVSDGICKNVILKRAAAEHNMINNGISICANCGKEGSSDMNTCNKCKMATYCNAACKKKHRHKHKKDCEEHQRLADECATKFLTNLAEIRDEKLFKQPPPAEDCQICFLRMPSFNSGRKYMACCGKNICSGCAHAPLYDDQGNEVDNDKCPFCRTLFPSGKEVVQMLINRMEKDDAETIHSIGCNYSEGLNGFPQDYVKALELYHHAAELGYSEAYSTIACLYEDGEGVEVDEKMAVHYYELAAMMGSVTARYNLGNSEIRAGNMDRALKHYMIAVKDGHADSLQEIQDLFTSGHATKEDYTKALRSYQAYLSEIKSRQRDEAAAADEEKCRYY